MRASRWHQDSNNTHSATCKQQQHNFQVPSSCPVCRLHITAMLATPIAQKRQHSTSRLLGLEAALQTK